MDCGSWFEIDGYSEAGYFLGHEVVKVLAEAMSFGEIALLDDFEECSREILERMIEKGSVV